MSIGGWFTLYSVIFLIKYRCAIYIYSSFAIHALTTDISPSATSMLIPPALGYHFAQGLCIFRSTSGCSIWSSDDPNGPDGHNRIRLKWPGIISHTAHVYIFVDPLRGVLFEIRMTRIIRMVRTIIMEYGGSDWVDCISLVDTMWTKPPGD